MTATARAPVPALPAVLPSTTEAVRGIQLQVAGGELVVRLSERIRWHRARGDALLVQMKKLSEVERDAEDDLARVFERHDSPRAVLEKKLRQHQARAAFLTFLRNHLDPSQVYQLDTMDLRMTEILPDAPW